MAMRCGFGVHLCGLRSSSINGAQAARLLGRLAATAPCWGGPRIAIQLLLGVLRQLLLLAARSGRGLSLALPHRSPPPPPPAPPLAPPQKGAPGVHTVAPTASWRRPNSSGPARLGGPRWPAQRMAEQDPR